MCDLLPYRLRAADNRENALLDVVPRLLFVKERAAILDDRRRRLRRRVPRRRDSNTLQQVLDEVPEVRLELLARLPVRLGDIDRDTPTHLFGFRLVTFLVARLAEQVENALERVDVKVRN